ncbi:ABC transporter permease [Rhodococcus rhodochrous]|uniref:ABC transporter permease n=1 Tax=Rhodococcus rhodochrous TaxID=1829 RepID=UPI001E60F576|nr:ABC transporter permease [Rhodococcus rhodochrous]MCD2097105.1 ABC transporter permease [Rhodococcus rhodochrous]MCD2120463.1 ABC transporter permease [Rhodococcus rhodochrous]MCQ4133065.1 ABC transporter permease [Rhodococcus rhodochrous]MDJ0017328.1 ABC transporter permease [Rhodococcus rhodochrous]
MTITHEAGHGSSALTGTRTLLHRVLLNYRHPPALLFVTLTAPLGMMLLFGFVFAGALSGGEGATYRAYLMPGVLVLVAAMGLATTAATVNADMRSGLSDRFRTLPTSPVAAPAGLVFAETLTCAVTLAPMVGIGYLVGWRIEADAGEIALAVLVLLLFRFALSWVGVWLGVSIRDEQVLQQCAPMIFGTIMFSNIFVPPTRCLWSSGRSRSGIPSVPSWVRCVSCSRRRHRYPRMRRGHCIIRCGRRSAGASCCSP